MNTSRTNAYRAAAISAAAALVLSGCSKGSDTKATTSAANSGAGGCAAVVTSAKAAVQTATDVKAAWTGPTTGPKAATGKSIVYVAQTETNPGVAGAEKGVKDAAAAIGWNFRAIDGGGDQAGISAAFGQAVALKPNGIVIGGFDPNTISKELAQAESAGIAVIGWHALGDPGPSSKPKLFSNVTTKVSEVSKISADYIISQSNGTAGVVVFTDNSIPFAAGKATMIENELKTCSSVSVLSVQNIPIPDAGTRTPQAFSSLISKLSGKWTYSVAINDLYFDNAGTPLRAAGKSGSGAPYNVGAGDGSAAAFGRIANKQFQAATIPEPLEQEGWQIVDEFNRSFNKVAATSYYPPVHVTDTSNVGSTSSWDPANGYQGIYKKIWGK